MSVAYVLKNSDFGLAGVSDESRRLIKVSPDRDKHAMLLDIPVSCEGTI